MITKLLEEIPRTKTALGFVGALLFAGSALAQDTNAPTVIKPTIVTGSYIPTAETVGPAPVHTLSTEAIEQSGTADALMTLKKLEPSFTGSGNYLGSVNNNVNLGAGFQAFSGESYAAIRNLPTLVLLDGQRIPASALSGAQAVDINTIPLSMIERVEVLKDGASAIYGSDAIGGVINIITKKNWNGFELGGRIGFPTTEPISHGLQSMAWLTAGASTENTRFVAGAQLFEQNALLTKDRLIGSQGIEALAGQNVVPPAYFSPSYPKLQNGSTAYVLASSPFAAGAPGYNPNLKTPPVFPGFTTTSIAAYNAYAIAHGYTDPTGHGQGPYIPMAITPVGQQLTAIGSGQDSAWPALNTTDYGTVSLLDQERRQFYANLEHDIFQDKLTAYSRFLYSDATAHGELAPSPIPNLGLYGISVPADNPYNPFGEPLGAGGLSNPRVRYRTVDFGNRVFQSYSDFYQWVGGLKGNIIPELSYDVSFDYGRERQDQQTRNAVNGAGLNLALTPSGAVDAQGRPLSMLNDFSGNGVPVFNIFGSGLTPGASVNAPETIEALRTTLFTWGESELYSAQGVFNARPIDLPAGKLEVAFGGQYIHEQLQLQIDGLTKLGLVPGLNAAAPFPGGVRETTAGFIEVKVPILGKDQNIPGLYTLELDVAGRYQTFDPGGDKAVPKVALLWRPLDEQITLRGQYGQGFIAPSIFNLFGPDFVSNPNVTINGANGQVQTQTRANPSLAPANSEQFGAGIVLSPKFVPGLTVSVDFYHVTEDNLPVADAQAAANSLWSLGPASPYAPGFTMVGGGTVTAPHQVTIDNWQNLIFPWQPNGALRTEGLDFGGSYVIPSTLLDEKYGKVTLGANVNLILNYEVSTGAGRPYYDWKGTWSPFQGLVPDYNLTASLTYELQGFTATALFHYLPETQDPGGLFPEYVIPGQTPSQGFTINNTDKPYIIPDWYTIDLQLSYELGKGKVENRRWWDGTKFTVGCNNIANMMPPLIPDAVEDNTDKNNYDILGRFVYFELSKKF